MQADSSRLVVTQEGEITRVGFLDRNIIEEPVIAQIAQELIQLVESMPNPRILLTFQGVEHLSSAALGTLITVHSRIKGKSGQLRLADIDPQIHEVFVITKLNKLFQIHRTSDAAVKSFA